MLAPVGGLYRRRAQDPSKGGETLGSAVHPCRVVRIHILGGGPAGLYFSILMKHVDPSGDVTVFERNARDDTFGWGVVFSDETLGHLRDADAPIYDAITEGFARWDAIEMRFGGKTIRSGGHGFCGIARKRLLSMLQARATELGVDLRFRTEVEDPRSLVDCDLLVAADGVNSQSRATWQDAFEPTLTLGKNRYIWLGTPQSHEAFTFIFRENEHGVFQVHAYQFDADTSTFIVECDEQTWRNAGLDQVDEAGSIAYLQALFAEDLGGKPLLGNHSRWVQFVNVKNAHWYHDNVVLVGDAAHTAHFSIGSGTKMAMEDVIALADALRAESDVPHALAAYEEAQRPRIARIQRAALESRRWFEQTRRHAKLAPEQLTFSLLTRTQRVTHDNLAMRDGAYVEAVDRWYMAAEGAPGADDPDAPLVPAMFTPYALRGLSLDNRVVVSPMCQYSAEDGTPNDWHMVHLGSRAVGGAALVFAEMSDVSREGRISPHCAGMYKEPHVAAWARIVDFVHDRTRARIGIQLAHAGRKGSTHRPWEHGGGPLETGGWPLVAPSPIAWGEGYQVPRELTHEDMGELREQFARSTRMAERAGFDALGLHMGHGYLLSSFLTPLSNQRTDAYGGSLANRARFPLEVLDAVRQAWPADKPIAVRLSAIDWVEGGFELDDAVAFAAMLHDHGADIIDVSSGQTSNLSQPDSTLADPSRGRAFQTPFSERIRNDAGVPTIAVGNIWSADQVNTILLAGRADLVALGRAHLADPYFTLHAAAQQGRAAPLPDPYLRCRPILEKMSS